MDDTRPTYINVQRRYLKPDTLDESDLPWEGDDVSFNPSNHIPPCDVVAKRHAYVKMG